MKRTAIVAGTFVVGAARSQQLLVPGDAAPFFCVNSGMPPICYGNGSRLPVQIMGWNTADPFTSLFWGDQQNSVQPFLQEWPNGTNLLLMSYAGDDAGAAANAQYMQQAIQTGMNSLNWSAERQQQFLGQVVFAQNPINTQPSFLPGLLATANWSSPLEQITLYPSALSNAAPLSVPRLDSAYGWLPWPVAGTSVNVSMTGMQYGCGTLPASVKGTVALLAYAGQGKQPCTLLQMALNAQSAGATGVIVQLPSDTPYFSWNCASPSECAQPLGIPVAQVSFSDGQLLAAFIANHYPGAAVASGAYTEASVPGFFLGIDELGELYEPGWLKLPSARFLSWEAQYRQYFTQLRANLTRPALVVPVANHSIMQGSPGLVSNVTLPPLAQLTSADVLELDLALGCPGPFQESCAIWDRTLELAVCCDYDNEDDVSVVGGFPMCGAELGRWITPFRRGVGRWLTDVTPLMPLLTGGASRRELSAGRNCSFTLSTDAWAMPWVDTLSLRFRNYTAEEARGASNEKSKSGSSSLRGVSAPAAASAKPQALLPLYTGGNFDKTYNNRTAISFATPSWSSKTLLYAVTSGHGSDENGCGEFCATSHIWTINGQQWNLTFAAPITNPAFGGADCIADGCIPNEHGEALFPLNAKSRQMQQPLNALCRQSLSLYLFSLSRCLAGTWMYGRDGWQDGWRVRPWVVDVTAALLPSGGQNNNTISYEGQFEGHSPNPQHGGAYMILASYLSFWG